MKSWLSSTLKPLRLRKSLQRASLVSTQIEAEQATHNQLENELAQLNEKLSKSKANLQALQESKNEYTKSIEETEQVYNKIKESSQNLLNVIKRDSKAIQKSLNQKKVP